MNSLSPAPCRLSKISNSPAEVISSIEKTLSALDQKITDLKTDYTEDKSRLNDLQTISGQKFDPKGDYIRQWCPELARLDTKVIHQPWEADLLDLQTAGVTLGKDYPHPIIAHADGRAQALEAFQALKKNRE